jgi:ArsR family transcriptional regulator
MIAGEKHMDPGLKEEITRLHAQICKALADPNRILLLYSLAERPHMVMDLVERLELPQPTVSRHLKVLKERGLVNSQRAGQSVQYFLSDQRIIEALDLLRSVLADNLRNQVALADTAYETLNL